MGKPKRKLQLERSVARLEDNIKKVVKKYNGKVWTG
jgi:hypothetical protein